MSVLGLIAREAAERFGDDTAYVSPTGWRLSYRSLDRLADETAAGLLERGIGEGDVVALALPQVPEWFVLYVAAARIGAITTGINQRLTESEQATVLEAAGPCLVAFAGKKAPGRAEIRRRNRGVTTVSPAVDDESCLSELRIPGAAPPPLPEDPERPVAIVFTSGTTGTPKGAVFAARQLEFITRVDTGFGWASPGESGTTFAATTLAHLGPMTKFPGTLVRGGTTILRPRWRADEALALVAEHRMAAIGGIPTQIALMLREPSFDEHDVSSVQAIIMGGGPATPALIREARARFGAAVATRYSCTEAGIGIGTAFDADPEDAEVSVGRPHPGVELAIRDPEAVDRASPAGDPGEVCLRSAAVMSGYWQDPARTAQAFTPDGFVRTGDIGRIDEAGRLRLVGRAKEMYVRGGYNVYPMEVEAVLAQHPGVADVAVAARHDDVMGEVGVAFVVPREGGAAPDLAELRAFAAGRLAAHKLPEELRMTDRLPLTAMDKIDRRALDRLARETLPTETGT